MDAQRILIAQQIIADAEEAEEQAGERPRLFLPKQDPFQILPEHTFIKYFRVSKDVAQEIIQQVIEVLQPLPRRRSVLTIETKVLLTLRFLGTGSYQEITGKDVFSAVSQASVSRSVGEIRAALSSPQILNQWVKFPQNVQELENLRTRFYEKYRFPGIVGIIDCTHVAIVAPPTNNLLYPEYIYVNRKHYHSINVQLICDENCKIMNVNARFPGSTHDVHIWRQSSISALMENVYRRHPENVFYLLGDSGYPLRPWIFTPLPNNIEPDTPEERFNNRLMHIRSLIERCNGILKNRFRCLLKHRVLHYTPEKAAVIIKASTVLHNMCIERNVPEPQEVMADIQIWQCTI